MTASKQFLTSASDAWGAENTSAGTDPAAARAAADRAAAFFYTGVPEQA
ncbi:hypothetical protein [Pseudonocardia sp.]|jgi:hypothetical protein